ncbi:MAG: hypothetical protein ACI4U2_06125 [Christensenellaceae bacterium]
MTTNYGFRTVVFSLFSLAFGIAYAAFCLVCGIVEQSLWFFALACYYVMLDVVRGGVLLGSYEAEKRKKTETELYAVRQYLVCGILLIFMTAFLSAMVIHIARQNKTFEYSLSVIYMTAGYTFYRIGTAVYHFFKSGKQCDRHVKALRCLNLAAALVSLLSLQSAALTAFSRNVNRTAANALTGGIVCVLIVAIGIYMIVDASAAAKRIRLQNHAQTEQRIDIYD